MKLTKRELAKMVRLLFLAIPLASAQQSTFGIAGGGYSPPPFLSAVPGELFTLFLRDLDQDTRRPFFAKSPPLPFEVNGLTVTISHSEGNGVNVPPRVDYPAAIHSIRQIKDQTALTIQVPPEIESRNPPSISPVTFNAAIRIMQGGNIIASSDLVIWTQRIRIVKSCDFAFENNPYGDIPPDICEPLIYREDGTLAGGNSVDSGEKIKVLVTGFGNLRQPGIRELLRSGWPNPDPALANGVSYIQEVGVNQGATRPWRNRTSSGPQPQFPFAQGTLIPGEYGIAAIEFFMPKLNTPPNGNQPDCPNSVATWNSNVTITIGDWRSHDALQLCVFQPLVQPLASTGRTSKGRDK